MGGPMALSNLLSLISSHAADNNIPVVLLNVEGMRSNTPAGAVRIQGCEKIRSHLIRLFVLVPFDEQIRRRQYNQLAVGRPHRKRDRPILLVIVWNYACTVWRSDLDSWLFSGNYHGLDELSGVERIFHWERTAGIVDLVGANVFE